MKKLALFLVLGLGACRDFVSPEPCKVKDLGGYLPKPGMIMINLEEEARNASDEEIRACFEASLSAYRGR